MNSNEVRWSQGRMVVYGALEFPSCAPFLPATEWAKEIVRDTDYVLLQMTGHIAHSCDLLSVAPKTLPKPAWPNYDNWPFPGDKHA